MTSYKIGTLKWDGEWEDRVEEGVWKEITLKTFDKGIYLLSAYIKSLNESPCNRGERKCFVLGMGSVSEWLVPWTTKC